MLDNRLRVEDSFILNLCQHIEGNVEHTAAPGDSYDRQNQQTGKYINYIQ